MTGISPFPYDAVMNEFVFGVERELEIDKDEFKKLTATPEVYRDILTRRFRLTNQTRPYQGVENGMAAVRRWLRGNCSDFYYINGQQITFWSEHDAVAFKLRFDGASNDAG